MPAHAPTVTLQVADNRLANAGYMRRVYPHERWIWEYSRGSNVYRWPGTNMVTLAPVYATAPDEANLSEWTAGGTGDSYVEVAGLWEASGNRILQQNRSATDCTLTGDNTPNDNQPFYLDFYFYDSVSQGGEAAPWYMDFQFCSRYSLRLLFNGDLQLWRNWSADAAAPDWQPVAQGKVIEKVFNQHLRLAVYPTSHGELLIIPWGGEALTYVDPEPLTWTDTVAGITYRTICPAKAPYLFVKSGAFYFSYRYMRFQEEGWLTFPQMALPWQYYGTYDLVLGMGDNRTGYLYSAVLQVLNETGNLVANPGTMSLWQASLDLTSLTGGLGTRDLYSPELNWVQLHVPPTYQAHTPTAIPIPGPGQLLRLDVGAGVRSRRQVNMALSNLGGAFSSLSTKLHMSAQVWDGTQSLWRGYVQRVRQAEGEDLQIELAGEDPLSRLDVPLTDAYIGDGLMHTDFVSAMLQRAGLGIADYSIGLDTSALTLPESYGLDPPLFQAKDGKTIREMVEYVGTMWSGWELYADRAGVIWYASAAISGTPMLTLHGHQVSATNELLYMDLDRQVSDEEFFNYIVVIGQSGNKQPLVAAHYDTASISDPASSYYLGMEKLLLVVDSNLRTPGHVETALGYLTEYHAKPQEEIGMTTDWQTNLDVNSIVAVEGLTGSWQVRGLEHKWEPEARMGLRLRKL